MEGFLVFDYLERYDLALGELTRMGRTGELKPRVSEFHGLEKAPQAFVDLLAGSNVGTTIVRIG